MPQLIAVCWVWLSMTLASMPYAADTPPVFTMLRVQAESLAEVPITLPEGLSADRTLVMMGFEFDHQKVMDEWLEKMALRTEQRPWLQLHVIGRMYGLIGGFINSRKRPYFPDIYQRERVVPVYTNVAGFLNAMGLSDSTEQVIVVVVRKDGRIMATARGSYDAYAAQTLRAALNAKD